MASATAGVALVRAKRFLPAVTASVSYGEAVDFDSTNRRVLFGLSVPLPLWNRREGDLAAAEAGPALQPPRHGRRGFGSGARRGQGADPSGLSRPA